MKKGFLGSYQWWVFVSYGFYLLLGIAWFLKGLMGGGFNTVALATVVLFIAQFYYKHLLINLIAGILCLFLTIYTLLHSLNIVILESRKGTLVFAHKIMVAIPIVSIVMAGILIFSYLKLNFKDQGT